MDCLFLLQVILLFDVTLSNCAIKSICSLKEIDVLPQSSYVVYGVRHDGHVFSFTESDVKAARSTPDGYLGRITGSRASGSVQLSYICSEVIFTESDGMLRRILRRRLCKPNVLDASSEGIPRSTEFLYSGDHRSQLMNGTTLRLFRIPETSHIRYYVIHSDEMGLHGGFIMWPNLTLFKIKGRHLRDLEVRFKTAPRPAEFQYVDVSRLWNNGEDLNLTKGINRLGKEWQFAFRTVRARTKCIESKGMDCDLHILWRYNRHLQYVYRRTEMRNNLMDEKELIFLSRAKPFKDSIFVGLRNGILFICPAQENMISINHMFNDAGFFAKENPDLVDWHLSTQKKIYLVSQHFKEVFAVAVSDNGTYYKAFSTLSDSLRAYTVDLSAFTHIPWLKFFMNNSSLISVDLSSNHLYLYYESGSWCVPFGKNAANNARKEDAPDSPLITDTFTGQRVAKKYPTQMQLFNNRSTYMTGSYIKYEIYDGGIIDTINIARTYYDSLLVLRTAEFVDTAGRPLIYGIKDCFLFAEIGFGRIRIPRRPKEKGCIGSMTVRMFYEKSHVIILAQETGNQLLHYFAKKVEFESSTEIWSVLLPSKTIWAKERTLTIGNYSSPNMCYVDGYMLHCFVRKTENIYKNGEMTRVSCDWSTSGVERVLNVPVAKSDIAPDYFYLKDGKDLIIRLNRSSMRYFSHNQRLWDSENPNELPCLQQGENETIVTTSNLLMSWSRDDIINLYANRLLDVKNVDFFAMSREPVELRGDGISKFSVYANVLDAAEVLPPAEQIRPPEERSDNEKDDYDEIHDKDGELPCNVWQKMATIIALCVIGGEFLVFLATVATIQLIAKPRLRRYRQQLGIASKRKKRAMKKRALKRLRKLQMRRLRQKRRHLLREQRRKEERKSGSEESSSSSSSSIGSNRTAVQTTLCPSAATGYDQVVIQHDEQSGKEPGNGETPHQESTRRELAEAPGTTNYVNGVSRHNFGLDRTTTQLPDASEENASRSRRERHERK